LVVATSQDIENLTSPRQTSRREGSSLWAGPTWTAKPSHARTPAGDIALGEKCSRRDLNPCQKLERLLSLATRLREREVALTAGPPYTVRGPSAIRVSRSVG